MMGNKGFLLGEFTLKVIIAILCVLVLVALLVGIYDSFSKRKQLAQAQEAVERVIERLRVFSGNELAVGTYSLTNPRNWLLLYYAHGEPAQCEGKACLCICEQKGWFSEQTETCGNAGVCQKIEQPLRLEKPIVIPSDVIFSKQGGAISLAAPR